MVPPRVYLLFFVHWYLIFSNAFMLCFHISNRHINVKNESSDVNLGYRVFSWYNSNFGSLWEWIVSEPNCILMHYH